MQEESEGMPTQLGDRLKAAIDRLTDALAVLDDVGVPLACAYVDLALSLCREELVRRGQGES